MSAHRMRFSRIARHSLLLLGLAAGGLLRAAPDTRLAGYWVSAPDETDRVVLTFSILGKWIIVGQQWPGAAGEFKVRYLVAVTGDAGVLEADEKLDKLPAAPRTIRYELTGGELLLEFPGSAHEGRHRWVKSSPPAVVRAPAMVDMSKPAPARPAKPLPAPDKPAPTLLGSWATEAGAEKQLMLFIDRSRTTDVKVNQQWIKGSDNPVVARNTGYTVTFANGRGQMALAKPEPEGSQIPTVLNFTFEGDALVIMVDDGNFAGQYRLLPKGR